MKNEHGLDANYFARDLERVLRDINSYTPDDLARKLARLAMVADEAVTLATVAPEQESAGYGLWMPGEAKPRLYHASLSASESAAQRWGEAYKGCRHVELYAGVVPVGNIAIQEAWEAAGGNPGIKASKDELLVALKQLDSVCDELQVAFKQLDSVCNETDQQH